MKNNLSWTIPYISGLAVGVVLVLAAPKFLKIKTQDKPLIENTEFVDSIRMPASGPANQASPDPNYEAMYIKCKSDFDGVVFKIESHHSGKFIELPSYPSEIRNVLIDSSIIQAKADIQNLESILYDALEIKTTVAESLQRDILIRIGVIQGYIEKYNTMR